MEVDRHSGMTVLAILEVPVFTADATTQFIDLGETSPTDENYGDGAGSLEYVVSIGAAATAGGTIECRIQESDTPGGTWADVPDEQVLGGEPLTTEAAPGIVIPIGAQNQSFRIGSLSKKSFQRMRLTEEPDVTAGQVSVVAIFQDFRRGARADQSS